MRALLIALLRAYQYLLSPWIGGSCRFWPTCSEYAREAIAAHGAARGSYMTAARLARCHPYGGGGVDPVPAQFRWRCWCEAETTVNVQQPDPGDHAQSFAGTGKSTQ